VSEGEGRGQKVNEDWEGGGGGEEEEGSGKREIWEERSEEVGAGWRVREKSWRFINVQATSRE